MTQAEIIKALTAAIDRGDYRYGDRLPTTRELAEQFSSSQQTVASALTVMASMGMVQVQRGWGSKVIAGKPGRINLGTYLSANREVATGTTAWARDNGAGSKEGPTQVSQTVTTESDADTGIPVGTEIVERTRTRFDADGAPCQHKRTLVTVEAATLTPEGWSGLPPMMSSGDVIPPAGMSIAKWLGMGVERISYEICTAPAASAAAAALTVPEATPCLRIVSRGVRRDGTVAYATVTTAPLRSSISLEIQDGAE
ncbi:GntR family transcriptional regulator [Streptomyces caniscabiei]|uniref:GntR family transcriptional regulator n=1 Tax=Streptomyces caniscabiei TaxID=2746961 RepID=UPI0029B04CE7|nr:GntR family transcriptional regulator [Streptomyces caniscabiei]MDX2986524.1 GntR family transcriptional regulator [Streptomyces caniscabiei]